MRSGRFVAQRLWLLERPSRAGGALEYAGAVAVLDSGCIYVLVMISNDASRAVERGLIDCEDRVRLERNALKFNTLDEATQATERIHHLFATRGWRDTEDHAGPAHTERQKETS